MATMGRPSSKTFTAFGDFRFDVNDLLGKLTVDENQCHVWTGGRHRQGYGMMGGFRFDAGVRKKIMTVAHRVAMMVHLNRPLGRQDYVIHTCTNPLCCNPDHLLVGGPVERSEILKKNIQEERARYRAGESVSLRFYRHIKYTDDEVRWIRTANTLDIADRYKVTRREAVNIRLYLQKKYEWVA